MTDTHGLLFSRDAENGVATITLSAPEKLNRVTMPARDRLRELFEELGRDESVRAIILRGEGRAFTAGGDIQGSWTPRRRKSRGSPGTSRHPSAARSP